MKIFFITSSYATLHFVYSRFRATYDGNHDTFRIEFLIVPCAGLAFLVNHDFTPLEVIFCMANLFIYKHVINVARTRGFFWLVLAGNFYLQILWTFSIYLEAVAILPQLFMISKTGGAESITSHYLFALGAYRGLYLFNWIYRYYAEYYFDLIAVVAGVVQTVLYCDFFYLYATKGMVCMRICFYAFEPPTGYFCVGFHLNIIYVTLGLS